MWEKNSTKSVYHFTETYTKFGCLLTEIFRSGAKKKKWKGEIGNPAAAGKRPCLTAALCALYSCRVGQITEGTVGCWDRNKTLALGTFILLLHHDWIIWRIKMMTTLLWKILRNSLLSFVCQWGNLVRLSECGVCSCKEALIPAQVVQVWLPEWLLDG